MIYPTVRAIGLAAIGMPLGLLVGVFAPHLWILGPVWLALIAALVMADAMLGADRQRAELSLTAPAALTAGIAGEALVQAAFAGAAPQRLQLSLEANARIDVEPARQTVAVAERLGRGRFTLKPNRRGPGRLERIWARWQGPLGLVWKQKIEQLARETPITLNIQAVKDE
ncbi:MAG TPA: DUF58 domain-containing protein, partial [Caulobacteraceae bacterium]